MYLLEAINIARSEIKTFVVSSASCLGYHRHIVVAIVPCSRCYLPGSVVAKYTIFSDYVDIHIFECFNI